MSWLSNARDDVYGKPQEPMKNSVQNLNEVRQPPLVQNSNIEQPSSWLIDAKHDVENHVDTTSMGAKGKKWIQDISDPMLQAVKDEESRFNQLTIGVNDAIGNLAVGALSFLPSIIMGGSRMAYEKIKNIGAEYPLSSKAISRKVARDTAFLPGLLPPPRNKEGKAIIKLNNKYGFIDKNDKEHWD